MAPADTSRIRPGAPDPEPVSIHDPMDVNQAYMAWGFATAGRSDLGEAAALEVATTALGDGTTSRLYRRIVDELGLATSISAWSYALGEAGLLGIDVVCAPTKRAAVEDEMRSIVSAVIEDGFRADEVRRAKAILEAEFAYANETNAGMTGTLGEFEVLFGDGGAFLALLDSIRAVTPEEVREALARRADPDRAVRAWVGPDGA